MKKVLGWAVIALVSMYFFPQVWYVILAGCLVLVVVAFIGALLLLLAKALGIAALELWLARVFLRKRKHT